MNTDNKLRLWAGDYDQLRNSVRAFRAKGLTVGEKEHRGYRDKLSHIQRSFGEIRSNNASTHSIPPSEMARREILLNNLTKEVNEMMVVTSKSRMDGGGGVGGSGGNNSELAVLNPVMMSDRGLVQRQEQTMKDQDEIIKEIGYGVERMNQQAMEMGRESQIIDVLDKLEDNVDDTHDDVREATREANKVREETRTFGLYVCAFVEFLLLVILIIVYFIHQK
jgi:hypothetical protein